MTWCFTSFLLISSQIPIFDLLLCASSGVISAGVLCFEIFDIWWAVCLRSPWRSLSGSALSASTWNLANKIHLFYCGIADIWDNVPFVSVKYQPCPGPFCALCAGKKGQRESRVCCQGCSSSLVSDLKQNSLPSCWFSREIEHMVAHEISGLLFFYLFMTSSFMCLCPKCLIEFQTCSWTPHLHEFKTPHWIVRPVMQVQL